MIWLRALVTPSKQAKKKDEATGAGAMEIAWKIVKDNNPPSEVTLALGLIETLSRPPEGKKGTEVGRDAAAALAPKPFNALWNVMQTGTTPQKAEAAGILCNLLAKWETGLEPIMENKRALLKLIKDLPQWRCLVDNLKYVFTLIRWASRSDSPADPSPLLYTLTHIHTHIYTYSLSVFL